MHAIKQKSIFKIKLFSYFLVIGLFSTSDNYKLTYMHYKGALGVNGLKWADSFCHIFHENPVNINHLNPFVHYAPFLYPPENIRKPQGFLMFSGGTERVQGFLIFSGGRERVHWERMG